MRECPAVAKAEIQRLESNGVKLSLDDLAWLITLGQKVETPAGRMNPLKAGVPAVAGSSLLWPETVQATQWLDAVSGWFSAAELDYLNAFALSVAREPNAFDDLYTIKAARAAVNQFASQLNCTRQELVAALESITPSDLPEREQGDKEPDLKMLALEMEVLTGRTREEVQVSSVAELCDLARIEAKYKSGKFDEDASASREPLRDLLLATQEILKSWQTE